MIILLVSTGLFLLWLVMERILHERNLRAIPLRISVTGTRGKSSVVRMLASVLRMDGRTVLAKTTGSRAVAILPDGSERDVPRRGIPSIIEQKRYLRMAAELGADTLVMEAMSIHPENHLVESGMLVQPHIVAVTNARPDHVEAMGTTGAEVAEVLALGIPADAEVFLPGPESREAFRRGRVCFEVERGASLELLGEDEVVRSRAFEDNLDLVCGLSRHLGIDDETIRRGIITAERDVGELAVWLYRSEKTDKECYLVNGFAANDPVSTREVLRRVEELLPARKGDIIGLLNLRLDRGDRTIQWLDTLGGEWLDRFSTLFVTGGHARAFTRRLRHARVLQETDPEKVTERIISGIPDRTIIFGFGNIGGMGELLVEYWSRRGTLHGV